MSRLVRNLMIQFVKSKLLMEEKDKKKSEISYLSVTGQCEGFEELQVSKDGGS